MLHSLSDARGGHCKPRATWCNSVQHGDRVFRDPLHDYKTWGSQQHPTETVQKRPASQRPRLSRKKPKKRRRVFKVTCGGYTRDKLSHKCWFKIQCEDEWCLSKHSLGKRTWKVRRLLVGSTTLESACGCPCPCCFADSPIDSGSCCAQFVDASPGAGDPFPPWKHSKTAHD